MPLTESPKIRMDGEPMLPPCGKNFRSEPISSIWFRISNIFPAMVIPRTGLVTSPFSIRNPENPIEKSPEIGLIVCAPIMLVTRNPFDIPPNISSCVLDPGLTYRLVGWISGWALNELLKEFAVDDALLFFAVYEL